MRQCPLFAKTAEVMHTGIEPCSVSFERLESAADDGVFLQHGDTTTGTRQEGTCDQASHSSADNDDTMLRFYCQNS